MGSSISDSWENEYLKKADRFEKICLREDKAGYEHDLQGTSAPAESACQFLKKTARVSKALSFFFILIIMISHSTSEHSATYIKHEEGYFERFVPTKVNE